MIQYFPIVTGSLTVLGNINVSGSITTSGSITISGSITSASFATSASNATNAISASYANNLTVAGTLTAQTLVVQTVTSSVIYSSGSNVFGNSAANTQTFTGSVSMNPNGLFVSSSGYIGIGTSSPINTSAKLEVKGDLFLTPSASVSPKLHFYNNDSTNESFIYDSGSSSNSTLIFAPAGSTKMIVSSSGNVGIGVTSPVQRLDVSGRGNFGGVDTPYIDLKSTDTTGVGWQFKQISFKDATNAELYAIGYAYPNLKFDVSGSRVMTLASGGNVGIGTNTPTGLGGGAALVVSATSNYPEIIVERLTSGAQKFGMLIGNSGDFLIRNYTTSINNLTISTGGTVYVGSTGAANNGTQFNVVGTNSADALARFYLMAASTQIRPCIRFDKYDNTNGTSQVFVDFTINQQTIANGSITGNGASQATFTSWSDRRLKENITELTPQLQNILALKPSEFDYKDGSGHQIGFIAQEMQEVYPDAVGENAQGFLTVAGWSKTEARLVKAIQELNTKFEEYKATHP